jgi:hypothetical protein
MKKTILALLMQSFLYLPFSLPAEEKNAVINPGFEESFKDYATAWTGEAFERSSESVQFYLTSMLKHSGARAIVIRNLKPNDSRLVQWVNVEPSSFYRIGVWVITQNLESSSAGAGICVAGLRQETPFAADTKNEWVHLESYGKTGPTQTMMPLALRLGAFGKTIQGSAAFDDVTVVRVATVPEGAVLYDFDSSSSLASIAPNPGTVPLSWIVAASIILLAILLLLALYLFRHAILDLAVGMMEGGLALSGRYRDAAQGEDKRLSIREPASIEALLQRGIQGGGYRILELLTKDLSLDGCFALADDLDAFDIGDKVGCVFLRGKRRIDVGPAQIVRKQKTVKRSGEIKSAGFGLRFIGRKSVYRYRVARLLKPVVTARAETSPQTAASPPATNSPSA